MKNKLILLSLFICGIQLIYAQAPEPGFVVFSSSGKVSATEGTQTYNTLRKGTKLTCNSILTIKGGSVTLTHPAIAPVTIDADGSVSIAERIKAYGKNACDVKAPAMLESAQSNYAKDKVKLNTAISGLMIPQKIKLMWAKPKYDNTYKVEIAAANAPEEALGEFETNDGDINIDLKKLALEPGVEYQLKVSSTIKKVAPAEAKFRMADIDNYKLLITNLEENNDFAEGDSYQKDLIQAFELEKAGYNYLASEMYDKLMDKYETNSELKRLYKQFNTRMGISRAQKK